MTRAAAALGYVLAYVAAVACGYVVLSHLMG